MARIRPAHRLWDLVDVAAEVFIAHGYRLTQMETVADALGVAKGTVYSCVESKEALFDAAVAYADWPEALRAARPLPLPTPKPGATIAKIRQRLEDEARDLELTAGLDRRLPKHPAGEFAAIVSDLYARLARNRRAIKIVDRCAADRSDLAAVWFTSGRQAQHAALVHYLERRIAEGLLRPVPDTAIAARIILETTVFWAVHRHWDPAPQAVRDDEIPGIITDLLLKGLEKERT